MYLALVCCLLFFNFSSASFITRTLPLAICPPSVFSLSECVFAGQDQRWATIFAISPRRRHTQPFLRLLRSSRVWARFLFSYFVPPISHLYPAYVTLTFTLTLLLWIFSHAISANRMSHELTRPAGTEVLAMDTIT